MPTASTVTEDARALDEVEIGFRHCHRHVRAADTDRVQLDANIARAQDLFVLLDRKIAKGEFVLAFQNQ